MRAAYGAMWIFAICLIFTIMMTAYLAISVNYAKAFRVKNHIISMIEEHEGYSRSLEESIDEYFTNQGYTARGQCRETISVRGYEEDWQLIQGLDADEIGNYGACVYKVSTGNNKNGPTERARYRVLTFFKFDIPVVSSFLTFQVGGESRYIYDFSSNSSGLSNSGISSKKTTTTRTTTTKRITTTKSFASAVTTTTKSSASSVATTKRTTTTKKQNADILQYLKNLGGLNPEDYKEFYEKDHGTYYLLRKNLYALSQKICKTYVPEFNKSSSSQISVKDCVDALYDKEYFPREILPGMTHME